MVVALGLLRLVGVFVGGVRAVDCGVGQGGGCYAGVPEGVSSASGAEVAICGDCGFVGVGRLLLDHLWARDWCLKARDGGLEARVGGFETSLVGHVVS